MSEKEQQPDPKTDPPADDDVQGDEAQGDEVEEGSEESFPASDPPAW